MKPARGSPAAISKSCSAIRKRCWPIATRWRRWKRYKSALPASPDYDCLRAARRAMTSRKAPKTSMEMPEYRLMLMSVNGARISGAKTPSPVRITPSIAKNKPEGNLRSILCQPDVDDDHQDRNENRQRSGALIPAGALVVLDLREAVH